MIQKILLSLVLGLVFISGGDIWAAEVPSEITINIKEPFIFDEAQKPVTKVTGDDGFDIVANYIRMIYIYGASIIGIICVLVMVISGIQMSFGGLASDAVSQSKERIFQALLSLALLFCSALILKTINPGFFTL